MNTFVLDKDTFVLDTFVLAYNPDDLDGSGVRVLLPHKSKPVSIFH
jgi:hypothetical protein